MTEFIDVLAQAFAFMWAGLMYAFHALLAGETIAHRLGVAGMVLLATVAVATYAAPLGNDETGPFLTDEERLLHMESLTPEREDYNA